jgi:hypothetical protein
MTLQVDQPSVGDLNNRVSCQTGEDGDGTLADDSANKATVYCGHLAFAYSGLAQLGGPTPVDGKPHTD